MTALCGQNAEFLTSKRAVRTEFPVTMCRNFRKRFLKTCTVKNVTPTWVLISTLPELCVFEMYVHRLARRNNLILPSFPSALQLGVSFGLLKNLSPFSIRDGLSGF
jgi:hypothetical protein